ncbi:ZIP family metal transporter (plasmid) [Natrinema zhouii]|uniref:ZIP family metal transporter n=1 Tax=Natrinema zhouii TaxID=1710539 RepID=UPI001CFF5646|nr:ZIP family metal transporter [Natrinema zhouii]UHQ99238.1 ZIP family metal transporter [Natrinema zhouii]
MSNERVGGVRTLSEQMERVSTIGITGVVAFVTLSAAGIAMDVGKVFVISWVAFAAMALGAWLGGRADATNAHRLVWGYGLASGAMITSAAIFLLPQAMGLGQAAGSPRLGGIGVAAGIAVGYSAHTISHRLTHLDVSFDVSAVEITAHALSAGLIIGLVYGSMPELGLLLGLAIISHKGPAGYAAARRLTRANKSPSALLLPAAGVGIAAIPASLLSLSDVPAVNAVVFGFAAGIFLHVAMDFLPNCEAGSEIDEVVSLQEDAHHLLDELRTHAVGSTALGVVAVVAAWALL